MSDTQKLRLMGKEIDLDKSPVLYDRPFTAATLAEDWEISGGEWQVGDEHWLTGLFRGNGGGILYSRGHYPGNVLLEFDGCTVPPCSNDLNFTWCSAGWNQAANDAGISYIAGLQGWWDGKAGIEHYPECRCSAQTPLLAFTPGQIYRIQAGSIDGHCFIFVDGRLVIELQDPDPIDSSLYNRVGIGTYASHIRVRNFQLRQITWQKIRTSYSPTF